MMTMRYIRNVELLHPISTNAIQIKSDVVLFDCATADIMHDLCGRD